MKSILIMLFMVSVTFASRDPRGRDLSGEHMLEVMGYVAILIVITYLMEVYKSRKNK